MAMVFATLIMYGRRKFSVVPSPIKDQVREILVDCGCGHLVDEE